MITDEGVKKQGTESGALMSSAGGGSSAIFGPDGRKMTKALDPTEEGILYADLDFDEITRIKMFAHCTGHYSRPDLLWLSTDSNIKGLVRSAVAKEVAKEITADLVTDL
jgi:nitrilase